jgi:hypothetical protein
VVFGRRPQHRRTADVDVLDRFLVADARLRDRLLERIQVDDDEISWCFSSSRIASSPLCTAGCSVLTRPSKISGNPVTSEMPITGIPSLASRLAVPPVEMMSTPKPANSRAKSTIPVLSETLISALRFANASTSLFSSFGIRI